MSSDRFIKTKAPTQLRVEAIAEKVQPARVYTSSEIVTFLVVDVKWVFLHALGRSTATVVPMSCCARSSRGATRLSNVTSLSSFIRIF